MLHPAAAPSAAGAAAAWGGESAVAAFHTLCCERLVALVAAGAVDQRELIAELRAAAAEDAILPPLVRAERLLRAAISAAEAPNPPLEPVAPVPCAVPHPTLRLTAPLADALRHELRGRVLRLHKQAAEAAAADAGGGAAGRAGDSDDSDSGSDDGADDTGGGGAAGGGALDAAGLPTSPPAGAKFPLNPLMTLGEAERAAWARLAGRLADAAAGGGGGSAAAEAGQRVMMLTSAHFADPALAPWIARCARAALSTLYSQHHREWFARGDYAALKAVAKRALYLSGAAAPKRKSESRRARLVHRRKVFKQRKRLYEEEERHRRGLRAAGLAQVIAPNSGWGLGAMEREERGQLERSLEGEFGCLLGSMHNVREQQARVDETMERSLPVLSDFLGFLEKEYDAMLSDLVPSPLHGRGLRPAAHFDAIDGIFADHATACSELLGSLRLPDTPPAASGGDAS